MVFCCKRGHLADLRGLVRRRVAAWIAVLESHACIDRAAGADQLAVLLRQAMRAARSIRRPMTTNSRFFIVSLWNRLVSGRTKPSSFRLNELVRRDGSLRVLGMPS